MSEEEKAISRLNHQKRVESEKKELNRTKNVNSHTDLQIANLERKTAEARKRAAIAESEALAKQQQVQANTKRKKSDSKIRSAMKWLKIAFLTLLLLVLTIAAILGLYYLYRLVTEEPIIETVTETVTETKEVIPEECTQVRRKGKVYISCDGVTVEGAPTVGESGVQDVPDLIGE